MANEQVVGLEENEFRLNRESGVLVTLNRPHDRDQADMEAFPPPHQVVLVVAVHRLLLAPVHLGPCLRLVSCSLLQALRGNSFVDIPDPAPWRQGYLLLQPTQIVRAFQLEERDVTAEDGGRIWSGPQNTVHARAPFAPPADAPSSVAQHDLGSARVTWGRARYSLDRTPVTLSSSPAFSGVLTWEAFCHVPKTCVAFRQHMAQLRSVAADQKWAVLYHYTTTDFAPLIFKTGFRMSTQGQGDGGVYFSTLGPATYGLGTSKFEENIIVDCFGKERLDEYRGKHKLDVCLVYGIDPRALTQAPGGRTNAKMVTKIMFEELAMPEENRSFYLRPDRLLGAFLLDPASPLPADDKGLSGLAEERRLDSKTQDLFEEFTSKITREVEAINRVIRSQDESDERNRRAEETESQAPKTKGDEEEGIDMTTSLGIEGHIPSFRVAPCTPAEFERAQKPAGYCRLAQSTLSLQPV